MPNQQVSEEPSKTEWVARIKFVALMLGFVLLIGFFVFEVYQVTQSTDVMINAIKVPEEIAKRGYTGEVVAAKLADEAQKIGIRINGVSKPNSWHKDTKIAIDTIPDNEVMDIKLPNSPWSFRTVICFILEELGIKGERISGELTIDGDTVKLVLRKSARTGRVPTNAINGVIGDIDSVIRQGGSVVLLLTNPKSALINAYYQFDAERKNTKNVDKTLEKLEILVEFVIEYSPKINQSLAYRLLGIALSDLKRYESAKEKYKKAVEADRFDPAVYLSWGNTLKDSNNHKGAFENYAKAIELDKNFIHAYIGLGDMLNDLKRPNEAIEQYHKAIELNPDFSYIYNGLGNSYSQLKCSELAIEHYRKAIDKYPNNAKYHFNWSMLLIDQGQYQEALEKLQEALKLNPNNVVFRTAMGNVFSKLNRHQEAIEQYQKALAIDATYAYAHGNLGIELQHFKQSKAAIKHFMEADKLNTDDGEVYFQWGQALQSLKRYGETKEKFKKAKDLGYKPS